MAAEKRMLPDAVGLALIEWITAFQVEAESPNVAEGVDRVKEATVALCGAILDALDDAFVRGTLHREGSADVSE